VPIVQSQSIRITDLACLSDRAFPSYLVAQLEPAFAGTVHSGKTPERVLPFLAVPQLAAKILSREIEFPVADTKTFC